MNPQIQLLKRAVDRNRFGRIYLANCIVHWARPQEYYDQAPWRGTWEFDGGAIMNQASHYVDLIQWLVGPVESVMAKTATQARRIEAEDSGVALLKFRSGALGVIEVNVLTYPRNLEGSITILGEHGSVKIGGTAVNKVEHWLFAEYDDDDKLVETANTNPPSVYGFGHEGYYRNVLAVLRGDAKPETDALLLPLRALDIGRGDEVIVPPFTFFATAGTVHNVGAIPVFVDIDPATFNMSPAAAAAARTPRTKAVIPVDLFGQMAAIEQ